MITFSKTKAFSFMLAFCTVAISSCNTLPANPMPTTIPVSFTQKSDLSFTPTVSNTPTLTITPSLSPTIVSSSTPQPEWVTRFAQPILDAIALRAPDFQDDFDDKSGGWQRGNWCAAWRVKYQDDALVVENCEAHRSHIDYPDFVIELDGRFLKATTGDASWAINFRDMDDGFANYSFSIYKTLGTVGFGGFGRGSANDFYSFEHAAQAGYETNHILVIAKGSEFAFYVNGKPLHYVKDTKYPWGEIQLQVSGDSNDRPSIVAFDNFKLWDISDISVP
jgi:hypothetical protein